MKLCLEDIKTNKMSYSLAIQNMCDEKPCMGYKCDKCDRIRSKYFIHLDLKGKNKYICSYICSKNMNEVYGKDYWDHVVNIEDFQKYPLPIISRVPKKDKFSMEYDMINSERNEFIQSLQEEDERIRKMEIDMETYNSSSSDYESD